MVGPRELGYDECAALLRRHNTGRVAVCAPDGPHIVPLHYAVDDDTIVLRTAAHSALATYGRGGTLAFEVDHVELVDDALQVEWSVIARGRGELLTSPDTLERLRRECFRQWPVEPWSDGVSLYLRLHWATLSGRRAGRAGPELRHGVGSSR